MIGEESQIWHISSVGAAYAPVMAALHADSFADPWDREHFSQLLSTPGVFGGIASSAQDADPVGFSLFRMAADECELITIGVVPACRRQGVARALLSAGLQAAQTAGAKAVFLEVAESNTAARAAYDDAGFTAVGRRERYYQTGGGRREAAIVLRRDL